MDGHPHGHTPTSVNLPAGKHTLYLGNVAKNVMFTEDVQIRANHSLHRYMTFTH